jgi:phosphoglycolate phosphatase-like HAD superfamily hydrolase
MRCSNCSHTVHPILALDIDGTLADYHGHFARFAEAYVGSGESVLFPKDYTGTYSFREFVCSKLGISEYTWRDIKLAYRQGAQKRSQPIRAGAPALLRTAKKLGVEVWLCTTRPYQRLDNIDPDTRFWLEHNGLNGYRGLLYDDDKYAQLADRVDRERVIMVIDDLYEMYDLAVQEFGVKVPVLIRNVWNRDVDRPAIPSLYAATDILTERAEVWRARYATV